MASGGITGLEMPQVVQTQSPADSNISRVGLSSIASIPRLASPGPQELRLPSGVSGEGSTIASPGPSVELAGGVRGKVEQKQELGGPDDVRAEDLSVKDTLSGVEAEKSEEYSVDQRNKALDAELLQPTPFGLNRFVLAVLFATVVLLKGCTYWGWNGFQDMFYKSGAYEWECKPGVPGYGTRLRVEGIDFPDCSPRKNSINNMYTVIFCTHFISSAFSGMLLDASGPKICMLAAILLEACGWLLFAFSSKSFSAYYAGAALLGVAADPSYLPMLSVSSLFPGNESFIMSIMGSFRSISFAVPVILSKIYFLPSFGTDDLWKILVCYVGVGLGACAVITFLLVPMKPFVPLSEAARKRRLELKAAKQKDNGCIDATKKRCIDSLKKGLSSNKEKQKASLEGEHAANDNALETAVLAAAASAEEERNARLTYMDCLKTPEFLLILPCFLVAILRTEFFSKSNKEQLVVASGQDLYEMFSLVNILSFIPGPVMGKLADYFGIVFVLALLNFFGILVYAFVMPDSIPCKAISLLCYFIYCSFVLSNLYCYVAVNFPARYFGKLTGLASLIGGTFSLTSLGWYKLSSETLITWTPYNFLLVDGLMVLFGVLNCFIILAMYHTQKKRRAAAAVRLEMLRQDLELQVKQQEQQHHQEEMLQEI